jgi:nicotinic acid mononucleotide adenylyltransferase
VYVYPRPEAPLPPVLPTSVTLLLAPLLPVSSTLVREKLARGEDVSALVPPPSLPLITRYYSPIEREASPEKA